MVLVDPLIERLKNKEKDVQIIRVEKTEHSEVSCGDTLILL